MGKQLQRRRRSETKSRSPAEEEYFTARSGSEVGDNASDIDSEEDMSSLHERKKLLASTFGESKFTKSSSASSTTVQQSSVKTSKTSSKFSVEESTSVKSTKSIEIKSSKTSSSSSKFESSTQSVKLQKSGGKLSVKQDEKTSESSSKTGKFKVKKAKAR